MNHKDKPNYLHELDDLTDPKLKKMMIESYNIIDKNIHNIKQDCIKIFEEGSISKGDFLSVMSTIIMNITLTLILDTMNTVIKKGDNQPSITEFFMHITEGISQIINKNILSYSMPETPTQ